MERGGRRRENIERDKEKTHQISPSRNAFGKFT
jgi:hypothetical protein